MSSLCSMHGVLRLLPSVAALDIWLLSSGVDFGAEHALRGQACAGASRVALGQRPSRLGRPQVTHGVPYAELQVRLR